MEYPYDELNFLILQPNREKGGGNLAYFLINLNTFVFAKKKINLLLKKGYKI